MTPVTDTSLPAVLRAATAEVIIERGLGRFSLREVARRAGVSHAAPGYHFGDMRGLLTSLAIEGFQTLLAEMEAASAAATDCRERLKAIGRAYVKVGIEYPAHMQVIFRDDIMDSDNLELKMIGHQAFVVLEGTLAAIAAEHNPDLDVRVASQLCWSAMQGLIELQPSITGLDEFEGLTPRTTEDLVDRFSDLVLMGIVRPVPDDLAAS